MSKIITVAIARHPQKDPGGADAITPHGAMQAYAAGLQLVDFKYTFDLLYYSGLKRAEQAARIMAVALGMKQSEPWLNDGLDFRPMAHQVFGDNPKQVLEEKAKFDEECKGVATLTHALENSEYARAAQQCVEMTIREMARAAHTRGLDSVLGVSHSPYFDTAAMHEGAIYGMPESGTIIWRVQIQEDDTAVILESTYIEPPIPGKRN